MSDNEATNANDTDKDDTDLENNEDNINADQSEAEKETEDEGNETGYEKIVEPADGSEDETEEAEKMEKHEEVVDKNENAQDDEKHDDIQRNQSGKSIRSRLSRKVSKGSNPNSVKIAKYNFDQLIELPKSCVSLFLSTPTLEIFNMKIDESVSVAKPLKFVPKEEILRDLVARAAVSDFSVLKNEIKAYDGEQLLLLYDATFKFGNNFVITLTEAAKEDLMVRIETPTTPGGSSTPDAEEDPILIKIPSMLSGQYEPSPPRLWVNLGSDLEIREAKVVPGRPLIRTLIQRPRRQFGALINFSASEQPIYEAIQSTDDNSFNLTPLEADKSESNAPQMASRATNTRWPHPRNATCQYEPRQLSQTEKEQMLSSEELTNDAQKALAYLVEAVQHNEVANYFMDDYTGMAPGDTVFDTKTDNDLKEFQTFADLKHCRDKAVTHIEWHPTIKGIIATSMAEKTSFDHRIDNYSRVILKQSFIILWSFLDPIQPQLLLEAPTDLFSFKFNPTDPHILAGGSYSGQIILWDMGSHIDDLRNVKARMKARNVTPLFTFDKDDEPKIPQVRWAAMSHCESSHSMPVTDLKWLPDHYEINNLGYSKENLSQRCVQLASGAADNRLLFWDTRANKAVTSNIDKGGGSGGISGSQVPLAAGVPDTFRFLDMKWRPTLRVQLFKSGPGGDFAATRFSLKEVQGDRRVLDALDDKENVPTGGTSGKERTLQQVNTHIYVGTEDGELVYVDWMPQKDADSGKLQTPKPDYSWSMHDGPVSAVTRCPFDRSLLLVVGGWIWSLWKEGVNSGPILQSCTSAKPLTGGEWSPTRSSVFFLTRADGSVEIWDLLDKTHEPTLVQNISSSAALTTLSLYNFVKKQLIAIGDINGGLHVYEVPMRFKQHSSSEAGDMAKYIEREVRRREFVKARWNLREHEKIEQEAEAKRAMGIVSYEPSSDEIKAKMKIDYDLFLQEEQSFLRELGLKDDDDEKEE